MPGDPEQCRLNAARYLKLSEREKNPKRRQSLAALAQTWARLAAEFESDQALLRTLSELEFNRPAVPEEPPGSIATASIERVLASAVART